MGISKFEHDILFNKYQNTELVDIRGHNGDIDTGTIPEDVWESGGVYTGRPIITDTTGKEFEIVSDSTNDADGGTGAQTVKVTYIDGVGYERDIIVTMNGTTPVPLGVTGWRVNKTQVVTAGTGNKNDGNITVRWVSPDQATIFDYILAGDSLAHTCVYTIPKGRVGIVYNYGLSITDNNTTFAQFSLMCMDVNGVEKVGCYCGTAGRADNDIYSQVLPALSTVYIRVNDVGSNDANVQSWIRMVVGEPR